MVRQHDDLALSVNEVSTRCTIGAWNLCELFAMSSRQPASVTFSIEEFARHGGQSAPHKEGWGIAYLQERDAWVIKQAAAAWSGNHLCRTRHWNR